MRAKRLYEDSVQAKRKGLKASKFKFYRENIDKMFDILACQCEILPCEGKTSCRCIWDCQGFHAVCSCIDEKRIPESEIMFVKD